MGGIKLVKGALLCNQENDDYWSLVGGREESNWYFTMAIERMILLFALISSIPFKV